MDLHEFQAKGLLRSYGVPVPDGGVASTASDALRVAKELKGDAWVIKAQVHAGGRGKAGGVKVVNTFSDVYDVSSHMLGMKIVTKQTGPDGKIVRRTLIEKATDIKQEIYLSFLVDRDSEQHMIIVSSEGGMDIEEVAENNPSAIVTERINPVTGMGLFLGRKIAKKIGLDSSLLNKFADVAHKLYNVFADHDGMMLEINPLVVTGDGDIVCLDAKMNVDENALYRHPKIEEMKDYGELEPQEVRASIFDLSYVSMDGNIGCMVNGAGLAMATMDIIKSYGGDPANFLDVGGGADVNKVREAFKIILTDPKVKVIFVNIFGGIVRCDLIAQGVLNGSDEVPSDRSIVVRLDGTNVEEGRKILEEGAAKTGLTIVTADTMADAAQKAVELAAGEEKPAKKKTSAKAKE
ncbi:succinyl-CoA synthetase beta subunit [Malonomonas rubra DSM 5091]|uniref:Succinate--CoA ligase [ADP-forming] subunit beta n=1 Tax=Malonomonas rubra DSM 5091 TaxID=1122189 RepID=A0A1M6II17_MALRU|nr:ADP-forming succinate--CoA ligase subunit beta [Malonomonas rubra]SHJ34092.1 succinyl-CoA synthetase beta subunit [Malonomonas rubra DSM 5091]